MSPAVSTSNPDKSTFEVTKSRFSKTVFFITHRLSSITHADRIIMMHQGKLEEEGTHEELISKKGRYYALYNQQKFENN